MRNNMYKKNVTQTFLNAEQVAEELGIYKPFAYKMISELNEGNLEMSFEQFLEVYNEERVSILKRNTAKTKGHLIRSKILPYFKNLKINEIEPIDVIRWQNELLAIKDDKGKEYSATYLRTIHGIKG
ncbi:hypothetical protein KPL28_09575 [Clostridium algidicarnis]|uniref:N-terminal phage integrase SAM-like domain-containing protein n=1 Tax=Clostridium algidicarnis TaxID=37659 RepID=UPI001C0DB353|nr:N-terminal phage integrase SAM-like domain-containing protein [Clostridium algidicarnis]MBU3209869.1 hypothetical protein [Clostridium algidicarnis]